MNHQQYMALPDALTLHVRGADMFHRGELADALSVFQQVLVLAQTAHTAAPSLQTTLDVLFAIENLGGTQRQLGDLPGAQALFQQAVALAETPPVGPAHPSLAQALRDLGKVLTDRGRYDEADANLQRALTMQEKLLGPDHASVAATLTDMGQSCLLQGNIRRAKGLLKRAVAIGELHVVPDQYPGQFGMALNALCQVYNRLEDFELAQDMSERHLALEEQFHGPNHTHIAPALANLAAALSGQSKFSEAQTLYERALAIYERTYGSQHPRVATCLFNLGSLKLNQDDHRRAKPLFERALAIQEQALGPKHLEVATTLTSLADCFCEAFQFAQGKTLLERALTIYQTQLGRTHPETADILERLAVLASMSGQSRKAAAFTERAAVAAVAATHQPCGWCGKMDVHAAKKCGRCQAVWYCNEECQRQAWPEHKKNCHKKPAAPVSAAK
jgi:tetratricopeptide (TPR) repeat protein